MIWYDIVLVFFSGQTKRMLFSLYQIVIEIMFVREINMVKNVNKELGKFQLKSYPINLSN